MYPTTFVYPYVCLISVSGASVYCTTQCGAFNLNGLISRPNKVQRTTYNGCSGIFGLDTEPFGCNGYFGVAYAIMVEACSHAWGSPWMITVLYCTLAWDSNQDPGDKAPTNENYRVVMVAQKYDSSSRTDGWIKVIKVCSQVSGLGAESGSLELHQNMKVDKVTGPLQSTC